MAAVLESARTFKRKKKSKLDMCKHSSLSRNKGEGEGQLSVTAGPRRAGFSFLLLIIQKESVIFAVFP